MRRSSELANWSTVLLRRLASSPNTAGCYQVLSERKAIVIALNMLADAERRTGAIAVAAGD